ncbi:hypothetical protein PG985_010414 [Apiospora marii]|uniref:Uncharacterized protein n=1 Tax=Apiospora marii TaxID=335849 RepID=A0ABR1RZA9_9PEZI
MSGEIPAGHTLAGIADEKWAKREFTFTKKGNRNKTLQEMYGDASGTKPAEPEKTSQDLRVGSLSCWTGVYGNPKRDLGKEGAIRPFKEAKFALDRARCHEAHDTKDCKWQASCPMCPDQPGQQEGAHQDGSRVSCRSSVGGHGITEWVKREFSQKDKTDPSQKPSRMLVMLRMSQRPAVPRLLPTIVSRKFARTTRSRRTTISRITRMSLKMVPTTMSPFRSPLGN